MMHDAIVTVNQPGPGFVLWLFPDVSPLHVWRTEHKANPEVLPKFAAQGYAHPHRFSPGESFRLNWLGSEHRRLDNNTSVAVRYDTVCLVQQQETAGDPITRVFKGVISSELLDRSPHVDDAISVAAIIVPDEYAAQPDAPEQPAASE